MFFVNLKFKRIHGWGVGGQKCAVFFEEVTGMTGFSLTCHNHPSLHKMLYPHFQEACYTP